MSGIINFQRPSFIGGRFFIIKSGDIATPLLSPFLHNIIDLQKSTRKKVKKTR